MPRGEEPTENGNTDGSGPAADGGGDRVSAMHRQWRTVGQLVSQLARAVSDRWQSRDRSGVRPPEADGVIVDADGDTAGQASRVA